MSSPTCSATRRAGTRMAPPPYISSPVKLLIAVGALPVFTVLTGREALAVYPSASGGSQATATTVAASTFIPAFGEMGGGYAIAGGLVAIVVLLILGRGLLARAAAAGQSEGEWDDNVLTEGRGRDLWERLDRARSERERIVRAQRAGDPGEVFEGTGIEGTLQGYLLWGGAPLVGVAAADGLAHGMSAFADLGVDSAVLDASGEIMQASVAEGVSEAAGTVAESAMTASTDFVSGALGIVPVFSTALEIMRQHSLFKNGIATRETAVRDVAARALSVGVGSVTGGALAGAIFGPAGMLFGSIVGAVAGSVGLRQAHRAEVAKKAETCNEFLRGARDAAERSKQGAEDNVRNAAIAHSRGLAAHLKIVPPVEDHPSLGRAVEPLVATVRAALERRARSGLLRDKTVQAMLASLPGTEDARAHPLDALAAVRKLPRLPSDAGDWAPHLGALSEATEVVTRDLSSWMVRHRQMTESANQSMAAAVKAELERHRHMITRLQEEVAARVQEFRMLAARYGFNVQM